MRKPGSDGGGGDPGGTDGGCGGGGLVGEGDAGAGPLVGPGGEAEGDGPGAVGEGPTGPVGEGPTRPVDEGLNALVETDGEEEGEAVGLGTGFCVGVVGDNELVELGGGRVCVISALPGGGRWRRGGEGGIECSRSALSLDEGERREGGRSEGRPGAGLGTG
eukprot:scaffold291083_cov28-Tisochrysis_lutea.AAC.1